MDINKTLADIIASQAENKTHIVHIREKLEDIETSIKEIREAVGTNEKNDIKRFHKILMIVFPALCGGAGIGGIIEVVKLLIS